MKNTAADPLGPTPPKYAIGSVDSALRLLLLVSGREEVRVAEASRELGIGRSTAHRLMQMLEFYGFVTQNPDTRAYVPGPVMANAGMQLVGNVDLRELARNYIEELASRVQETVHLQSLRRDGLVVCLDSVEGSQPLRVGARTGQILPSHATAGGQALLATLTTETITSLFPTNELQQFTPTTVPDRDALVKELAAVRRRGYGISRGGYERDICGIGVAVPDKILGSKLAIAVAVPRTRFDDEHLEAIAFAAKNCGECIARALTR